MIKGKKISDFNVKLENNKNKQAQILGNRQITHQIIGQRTPDTNIASDNQNIEKSKMPTEDKSIIETKDQHTSNLIQKHAESQQADRGDRIIQKSQVNLKSNSIKQEYKSKIQATDKYKNRQNKAKNKTIASNSTKPINLISQDKANSVKKTSNLLQWSLQKKDTKEKPQRKEKSEKTITKVLQNKQNKVAEPLKLAQNQEEQFEDDDNQEQLQQEQQRSSLPNPIQLERYQFQEEKQNRNQNNEIRIFRSSQKYLQEGEFTLQNNVNQNWEAGVNNLINYDNSSQQQDSSQENVADYSFQPKRFITEHDSPSFGLQQAQQLQINMDLFEKSAEELMALDFLSI